MPKPPSRLSSSREIASFLNKSKAITQFVDKQPRLVFAIDATASRQPTWDTATHQQQAMFQAVDKVASLSVQLVYFRGFQELRASRWLGDSQALAQLMGRVFCEGGHTQIKRLLRHALDEHSKARIRALVFIGDAMEESPDTLCELAGQCGMLGLPLFIFQEGTEPLARDTFQRMARLSGGAFARFDDGAASRLAELLGAVASFAAGGHKALEQRTGDSAKLLLQQLKNS